MRGVAFLPVEAEVVGEDTEAGAADRRLPLLDAPHRHRADEEQGTGTLTWERIRAQEEVTGDVADLTDGLRAWAIATATREQCGDGRYSAYLVTLDADDRYDIRDALAFDELVWFYGVEHVPAR